MSSSSVVAHRGVGSRLPRRSWIVACVAALVLLGSTESVAVALDQANTAPQYFADAETGVSR